MSECDDEIGNGSRLELRSPEVKGKCGVGFG
jgi:hypothetical protein